MSGLLQRDYGLDKETEEARTTDCKSRATRIVIFGHNHDWALDKDSWFVDDRIYANCGTWIGDGKPKTFVETERDPIARRYYVRLREWQKNKVVKRGEEYIDL